MGTRAQVAPHPPDPRAGQTRLTSRPAPNLRAPARAGPRCSHSPACGAAGSACPRLGLRAASGCGSRSPAKRPARAAGTRQGQRSAGAGTGRRRHPRGAGKRCAAGGIRAGRELTWVRGRREAGGGGGIPSGTPPASPAPRLQQRWRSCASCLRKEGDPGGGGVGGLSRVQPPPPAQSRASEPPPHAASGALPRTVHPWRAPDQPGTTGPAPASRGGGGGLGKARARASQ